MREPWEMSPEQMHKLFLAGAEQDEIDELNEVRKDSYYELLEEVYGDDPMESAETHFYQKYGFEHICRCVDDVFSGNMVRVPRCRADMGDDALEALELVNVERDDLLEQVEALREQVMTLGTDPVA